MKREYLCKAVGFLVLLVVASYAALADTVQNTVQIKQVYYDPVATESGGEAIELYNPNNVAVNLSGYSIKTESADKDVVFLANHTIQAKGYFLVADFGWSTSKDNASWVEADLEETMNMFNADSGIGLFNSAGEMLDAVGWGDKNLISSNLYETEPALAVPAGFSLLRTQDTNNNLNDFVKAAPYFHNTLLNITGKINETEKNDTNNGETDGKGDDETALTNIDNATIKLLINNSKPEIDSLTIDDDSPLAGIQLFPVPAENKTVTIEVIAHDNNGAEDLQTATALVVTDTVQEIVLHKVENIDSTKARFSANFTLPYWLKPELYSVAVTVVDKSNAKGLEVIEFDYLSLVAVKFDAAAYNIVGATNGSINLLGDSNVLTNDKPTISNVGNTLITFGLASSDFTKESSQAVKTVSYSLGEDIKSVKKELGSKLLFDDTALYPADNIGLNLFFSLNEYIPSGAYDGSVAVYAVAEE